MDALLDLIKTATEQARPVVACEDGSHHWISEGGRGCPEDASDTCGQAVYRCTICGVYDYGEAGGPGAHDCATARSCEARYIAADSEGAGRG